LTGAAVATILIIVSCFWPFLRLNSWTEERIYQRLLLTKSTKIVSIARLVQRVIDVLAVFIGILVGLKDVTSPSSENLSISF
jgi:hypothetical protein